MTIQVFGNIGPLVVTHEQIIKGLERDLYWARHIAQHGQTPAQRERGLLRVKRFEAEILKIKGSRS